MSKWILKIEAEFDTKGSAEDALSDMEDAVGKNNGELIDSEIEHPDDDEDDQPMRPDGPDRGDSGLIGQGGY
jgi:hypothetical protein